jgi:hypothetical protein
VNSANFASGNIPSGIFLYARWDIYCAPPRHYNLIVKPGALSETPPSKERLGFSIACKPMGLRVRAGSQPNFALAEFSEDRIAPPLCRDPYVET